jgi:co-chaperonin GroES (HSP10)
MYGNDLGAASATTSLPLAEPLRITQMAQPAIAEDDRIDQTLHPTGFRILVQIRPAEEYLKRWQDSNLVMPDEVRDREWQAQLWAFVIELGPDAYKDEKRFPSGRPWCQPGDCILMRPYSGTRFMVRNQLYALINDDTVLAIVTDPGEIERA